MALHHTAVFVFVVIIGCNLILYPSLFSKLFRQWFGNNTENTNVKTPMEELPPPMRGRPPQMHPQRAGKHRASPDGNVFQNNYKAQEPGYKGIMGTVLPVYAIGIMIYFIFVIYKVFLKEKPGKSNLSSKLTNGTNSTRQMDRKLRQQEELLQQRLSEELRKHGYGNHKPSTPSHVQEANSQKVPNANSDAEVVMLQGRLAQTEKTIAKMLEMMNSMGVTMNQVTNHLADNSKENTGEHTGGDRCNHDNIVNTEVEDVEKEDVDEEDVEKEDVEEEDVEEEDVKKESAEEENAEEEDVEKEDVEEEDEEENAEEEDAEDEDSEEEGAQYADSEDDGLEDSDDLMSSENEESDEEDHNKTMDEVEVPRARVNEEDKSKVRKRNITSNQD